MILTLIIAALGESLLLAIAIGVTVSAVFAFLCRLPVLNDRAEIDEIRKAVMQRK